VGKPSVHLSSLAQPFLWHATQEDEEDLGPGSRAFPSKDAMCPPFRAGKWAAVSARTASRFHLADEKRTQVTWCG